MRKSLCVVVAFLWGVAGCFAAGQEPAAPAGAASAPAPAAETKAEAAATSTEAEIAWTYGAKNVFGKESEDAGKIAPLFENEEKIRHLLGGEPAYVYLPSRLPDPFVIPWRRMEVVAKELLDAALKEESARNYPAAKDLLERITSEMRSTRVAEVAKAKLDEINQSLEKTRRMEEEAKEAGVAGRKLARPFPAEVAESLKGILWSESDPKIIVGDTILGIGETAPNHDDVKIKKIEKHQVVFVFDGAEHAVKIDALGLTPVPEAPATGAPAMVPPAQ